MKYNVITALKEIHEKSQNSQLKPSNLGKCQDAILYIEEKLNITEFQALLLSVIINSDESIETTDITSFFDISLLDFSTRIEEVNALVNRKYIRRITDENELYPSYKFAKEAFDSLMKDESYTALPNTCHNYIQLMTLLKKLHKDLATFDICTDEYKAALLQITQENQHLPLCQKVKDMSADDQIVYYTCADEFIAINAEFTPLKEIIRQYHSDIYSPIMESLISHNLPLLKRGIISFHNEEQTEINLSADILQHIQSQIQHLRSIQRSVRNKKGKDNCDEIPLIKNNLLTQKQLFYNDEEQSAINKLTNALQPKNFQNVQTRLENNNMRKGFTCLFYGKPGTGKTETVFQIARATHRHILQIDVSKVRSKWVGESEKNLREYFNKYRTLCQTEEQLPIFLINEADALISQRITNLSQSSDKEENALQNILLEEMERFEGILIATTNLQDNFDSAFERRFLYKVQFHSPSPKVREDIWRSMLSDITPSDAKILSESFDFSGGEIENVVRKHLIENALTGQALNLEELTTFCKQEVMESKRKIKHIAGFGR